MICRNAAFYRVWSLLTQTANQSFRGFIFTLAGDCQRVFTANLSASFPEQRTHKGQKFSCWTSHKSSQGGRLFCVFCWFGFFHLYWVWGASLKNYELLPSEQRSLTGCAGHYQVSSPGFPSHLPARGYPRQQYSSPCWCGCENSREVPSNLAPVPGIWTCWVCSALWLNWNDIRLLGPDQSVCLLPLLLSLPVYLQLLLPYYPHSFSSL